MSEQQKRDDIEVTLVPPELAIMDEYHSGYVQEIESVEVELKKPIIVKYSEEDFTEFHTLLPVKIVVKRL
jgi:Fe-S cluster assembly ATPase SufC